MRQWIALLFIATALSGCAGDDGYTAFEPTQDDATVDDGNGTVDGANQTVANAVPELRVLADVVNGTAPLLVNFTIDAVDDSENLTWTLAIGGNETYTGDAVPAVVNHTFEAGNWTVVLSLTDGEHTVEESLEIVATAPVAEERLPDIVFEGTVLVADPWAISLNGCLLDAGRRDAGGPNGITGTRHNMPVEAYGRPYSLDVSGLIVEFWGPGSSLLGVPDDDRVPEDAEYAVICINDASKADVDYVWTISS